MMDVLKDSSLSTSSCTDLDFCPTYCSVATSPKPVSQQRVISARRRGHLRVLSLDRPCHGPGDRTIRLPFLATRADLCLQLRFPISPSRSSLYCTDERTLVPEMSVVSRLGLGRVRKGALAIGQTSSAAIQLARPLKAESRRATEQERELPILPKLSALGWARG